MRNPTSRKLNVASLACFVHTARRRRRRYRQRLVCEVSGVASVEHDVQLPPPLKTNTSIPPRRDRFEIRIAATVVATLPEAKALDMPPAQSSARPK
jgi:hypothetical protein